MKSVGAVVITHNAREHLSRCITPLRNSAVRPEVLVVNSSSDDGTVEEANRLGAETLVIPRGEFNHGTTRELARKHLGTDVVVMMTPDAYPVDADALGHLIAPVLREQAAVAYGRQVPREGADFFERFGRCFNYPATSGIRSVADAERAGVRAFFCSNAFAAWSNADLDAVGGFPDTLSHEDAILAARLLLAGYRVAYVAEAVVVHSHPSSLVAEFKRHFDAGYARREFEADLGFAGSHASEGWAYARTLLRQLAAEDLRRLPYGLLHLMAKWTGFQAGRRCVAAPRWVQSRMSGQDYYWSGATRRPPASAQLAR